MSIKKIAEITGTSPATVSRVLNNPSYKCAVPGLRDKIWRAAMDLNYTPNEAARDLKKGAKHKDTRHFLIEILITRVDGIHSDPYFEEQLRAVETQIHRNACILSKVWYQPVFSDDSKCDKASVEPLIRQMSVDNTEPADGLIIIGRCNPLVIRLLQKSYKNIVAINRNSANYAIDEVICDGKKITAIGMLKCLNRYSSILYRPSIISCDDIEEGQFIKPMLSTVQLPKENMARFALFVLLDRIRGGHKEVIRIELEGKLLLRSSCCRVEDVSQPEYYI